MRMLVPMPTTRPERIWRRILRTGLASGVLGLALMALTGAQPASAGTTGVVSHDDVSTDWTVYHHDPLGSGVDTSGTVLSPLSRAWTSPVLDGQLYGEPLEYGGRIFVATEADTLYALAANTGQILWSTTAGVPVPSSDLPCGDIGPTVGITSTPVIDPALGEIFAVEDSLTNGAPAHVLVALSIYSGTELVRKDVDPPGSSPAALLQRVALTLDDGNVVFGFGGNDGDCSTYHGWVASVPEGGGPLSTYEVDSGAGESQGAVWMGGAAPIVDSSGNIWVSVGNGSVNSPSGPYDDSDSVLELSASLGLKQFFAPADWYSDNGHDRDLGSSSPALLADGEVVQAGKSQTGYLLSQASLGGIGGQQTSVSLCSGHIVGGGNAVVGTTVYMPCEGGVEAVSVSTGPPGLAVQWQTSTGSSGPPIVAGGLVWTISQDGTLYGLNPSTGAATVSESIGAVSNHFPTPSVGDGLLLVPASEQVVAFAGPAGLPGPPSPVPVSPPHSSYWMTASDGGIFSFGNAQFHGSTGNIHLNKPIVGMATTPSGGGYWLVGSDGGVFTEGNAPFEGSTGNIHLNKPIVGMAATPDGGGYWLVASDGGVFTEGDAPFEGSTGNIHLNAPIVGMAATPSGKGYWLVASDGGIFTEGDAQFHGSLGNIHLNQPIVGMAATPDGGGYWLVASDGGVFSEGDAVFYGSAGATHLNKPIVGMATSSDGGGYWLVASDGGIFTFGDAKFSGSEGGFPLNQPVVGMAIPPKS
jgi:outer membrane protein assembly factor BamB